MNTIVNTGFVFMRLSSHNPIDKAAITITKVTHPTCDSVLASANPATIFLAYLLLIFHERVLKAVEHPNSRLTRPLVQWSVIYTQDHDAGNTESNTYGITPRHRDRRRLDFRFCPH